MPRRKEPPRDVVADRRREERIAAKPISAEYPTVQRILLKLHYHDLTHLTEASHEEREYKPENKAFFNFACPYSATECRDGGHDLSGAVRIAVLRHETNFKQSLRCQGQFGRYRCSCELDFEIEIEYASQSG